MISTPDPLELRSALIQADVRTPDSSFVRVLTVRAPSPESPSTTLKPHDVIDMSIYPLPAQETLSGECVPTAGVTGPALTRSSGTETAGPMILCIYVAEFRVLGKRSCHSCRCRRPLRMRDWMQHSWEGAGEM